MKLIEKKLPLKIAGKKSSVKLGCSSIVLAIL